MIELPPEKQRELERAVEWLEQPRLAVRLANFAGRPLDKALKRFPGVSGAVHATVRKAIFRCLSVAIESQNGQAFTPSAWRAKMLTGLSGGIGGLFGAAALPVELPVTMTLMLRAIADIARENGEDLTLLEPRLACLQVFALGDRKSDAGAAIGYYAVRTALTKLTADVVSNLVERTVLDASTPVVSRLVSDVVSRFGLVLSERTAAGAIPVLGAVGGATINVMFMDHFERLARGHFTVRRLEREHGRDLIQELYGIERERTLTGKNVAFSSAMDLVR
jgi:hypothetical protein